MKKFLLLFILAAFFYSAQSQCTPDTAINSAGGYLYPVVLPFATAGVQYSQVLTFRVPLDTFINVAGTNITARVDTAQLINIYGIPTGYSYQCNIAGCYWLGGSIGCAKLSGVSDTSTIGSYSMLIAILSYVRLGNNAPYTYLQRVDTSSYIFKIQAATGIFEIEPYVMLKAYPNPVNDKLTIELNDIKTNNNTIEVFDNTGRKVFVKEFSKPSVYAYKEEVDLSNLSKGLYTVVLTTDDKIQRTKVIRF